MERPEEVLRLTKKLLDVRIKTLADVVKFVDYLMSDIDKYDTSLLFQKSESKVLVEKILQDSLEFISQYGVDGYEVFSSELAHRYKVKRGIILWPIRVAISGKTVALPLFDSLKILGKEDTTKRISIALSRIKSHGKKEQET